MQQKVQFIVTVVHEPKLLILDEPFSGFDPINASLVRNEILDLKAKGHTIIFSTHNMGSVEEIVEGSVRDIRRKFRKGIYEIEFKGNMLGFTNALWTGFELTEKHEGPEFSTAKVRLLDKSTANDLLKSVVNVAEVHGLREIVPSMNDVFIELVSTNSSQFTAHSSQ
jgi:ABC-2 type transport system ATP-binding protein